MLSDRNKSAERTRLPKQPARRSTWCRGSRRGKRELSSGRAHRKTVDGEMVQQALRAGTALDLTVPHR